MFVLLNVDGAVVMTVGPMTAATCPTTGPTNPPGGVKAGGVKPARPAGGVKAGRAALALAAGARTPTALTAATAAKRFAFDFICTSPSAAGRLDRTAMTFDTQPSGPCLSGESGEIVVSAAVPMTCPPEPLLLAHGMARADYDLAPRSPGCAPAGPARPAIAVVAG
jgi:hypothetical protein